MDAIKIVLVSKRQAMTMFFCCTHRATFWLHCCSFSPPWIQQNKSIPVQGHPRLTHLCLVLPRGSTAVAVVAWSRHKTHTFVLCLQHDDTTESHALTEPPRCEGGGDDRFTVPPLERSRVEVFTSAAEWQHTAVLPLQKVRRVSYNREVSVGL